VEAGRVIARDDLLRAHVFAAFDARGTDAFPEAVKTIVHTWELWPIVACERELEDARRLRDQHRARLDHAADWIRESYVAARESAVGALKPSGASTSTKRRREPLFNGWVTDETGTPARATRDQLREASRLWYQHRDIREGRSA